ncbi:hypothetical protein N7532_003345 [Penicillium argentinense]|uniref:Uncharacterized protein n=1 Tax=Penicillium argentinense TaxID=1131581 RepID=A0A9W9FM85_9EURO|nr:uncharacterized protein N7532_003345 [Penicillium argentinense]KAJ5102816.1 hypothetical protein N7532_003345 [Penicillium argentinense]
MSTDLVDERSSRVSGPVFKVRLTLSLMQTGECYGNLLECHFVQLTLFRRLLIDDFLIILAWVIIFAAATIWQVERKVLYELYTITAGREAFEPAFLPRYNEFISKIKSLWIWWFVIVSCTAAVYIASVGGIEYKCSFGGIEYIIGKRL